MYKLGFAINHKKNALYHLLVVLVTVLYFFLMVAGTVFMSNQFIPAPMKIFFFTSYFVVNGYMTMFLATVCIILFGIYQRFELINEAIKCNFRTEEEDAIRVFSRKSLSAERLIIKLADLHDAMVDTVNRVNFCYAVQVSY